jgi:hypothetical protein
MQVAAVLGHELVHAAVGVAAHHGKEFRRVARGIGLVGQMTANHRRTRIRAGPAADTGGSRAAAPRQPATGRWRQQPFQSPQKAVLAPDQVCLQQLRLHRLYVAQMARCGRRTALPAARPNDSGEDVLNHSLAKSRVHRLSSCGSQHISRLPNWLRNANWLADYCRGNGPIL